MKLSEEINDTLAKQGFHLIKNEGKEVKLENDWFVLKFFGNSVISIQEKEVFDVALGEISDLKEPTIENVIDMYLRAMGKLLECFPLKNETEEL